MMSKTFEIYGKPAPTTSLMEAYWDALSRFSFEEVRQGFNMHILNPDNGQFLPKPADVVRQIGGDTETLAAKAWTSVDYAIRTAGPWASVVFDDMVIHKVIEDMGGWITLCKCDGDEYPFKAKEFKTRYRGYAMRPPTQYLKKLMGIAEAENSRRGFKSEAPLLIGNAQAAAMVFSLGQDQQQKKTTRISADDILKLVPDQDRLEGGV